MKVVHAVWERRNLGVDCNEISIESADTVESIGAEIEGAQTEYTVVKVPAGRIDALFYLQSIGYRFIEAMTVCHHPGVSFLLSDAEMRFVARVSYAEMEPGDVDRVFDRIRAGMYTTDRVSLDPAFTREQANNRYVGWIGDELARGAQIYKLLSRDRQVGFFTFKRTGEDIYYPFLGGIYPEYEAAGFGIPMNYYEIEEGVRRKAKRILSSFSTNNRGAAAIHLKLGYVLQEQYYVLVKHAQEPGRRISDADQGARS